MYQGGIKVFLLDRYFGLIRLAEDAILISRATACSTSVERLYSELAYLLI
jgi:hypothetical protein